MFVTALFHSLPSIRKSSQCGATSIFKTNGFLFENIVPIEWKLFTVGKTFFAPLDVQMGRNMVQFSTYLIHGDEMAKTTLFDLLREHIEEKIAIPRHALYWISHPKLVLSCRETQLECA